MFNDLTGINMSKPVNDKDRKSMDTPLDPHLQSEQKSQMQSEQQPGQEPQKKSQQQQPSQQQDQRNQYSRTRKGATITPDQQTQSEQNRSNPKDATSSPDAQAQQKQDTSAEKGATAPPDLHAQGIPPTPFAATEEGKVELGNGLPALPPRPTVPLRKSGSSIPKHVPTVKQQVAQPQISIPPGSDLGIVGKIGAYQMSQTKPTSSATDIHANVYFWFYALTLFVTLFIMKKQK
jgi:DNA mismatch repair ATPase MutL